MTVVASMTGCRTLARDSDSRTAGWQRLHDVACLLAQAVPVRIERVRDALRFAALPLPRFRTGRLDHRADGTLPIVARQQSVGRFLRPDQIDLAWLWQLIHGFVRRQPLVDPLQIRLDRRAIS